MNTGQILKAKTDQPFTVIPNKILRDNKISAKAKGLLCFLLSLPPDWVIYKTTLTDYFKDGKDSLSSAWNELEQLGYVVSVAIIKNNLVSGYNHVVYYEPIVMGSVNPSESGFPENREVGNTESRITENPPLQKIDITKKDSGLNINKDSKEIHAFESFRKKYAGAKNGHDTELRNFQKQKDWKESVFVLEEKYNLQIEWRDKAKKSGMFVPEHANLQTWINQRRWEMEMPEIEDKNVQKTLLKIDPQFGYDTSKGGNGKVYNSIIGKFLYPADWKGEKV